MSKANERESKVRAALAEQGRSCAQLGSPFMERLMALLAERDWPNCAVADRVLGWEGDPAISADNPALRLAGGLHSLVLQGDPQLTRVYPPRDPADDTLWNAIAAALKTHGDFLLPWLDNAPQTNEVRRASAIAPALAMIARKTDRPLALWEIGCAAGLNLRTDQFRIELECGSFGPETSSTRLEPEWSGPVPDPAGIQVVERRGVDLSPLDPTSSADRLKLLSYLWPDQPHRYHLTQAAIALAADVPADVERADAVAWLREHLPTRRPDTATVLFHTVAWQYISETARAEGERLIAKAGHAATESTPLFRISMEADGMPLAALALTVWPGGETHMLGRADFHGRAVHWSGPTRL